MRLQKSFVSNCICAFASSYSCSIFCAENEFHTISKWLIDISKSPDGKIEMKRNTEDSVNLVQIIDQKSKQMEHDFPKLNTLYTTSAEDQLLDNAVVFGLENRRQDFREAKTAWAAGRCKRQNVMWNSKTCQYCFVLEAVNSVHPPLEFRRFKYCSQCQVVYYCSNECQEKDWQFHKLDCKRWKKMKKDQKAGSFPR